VRTGDRIQRREVTVGGGHGSGQLGWISFGLGSETTAEVRVTWPDGHVGPWEEIAADGFALVSRDGGATPWQPNSE